MVLPSALFKEPHCLCRFVSLQVIKAVLKDADDSTQVRRCNNAAECGAGMPAQGSHTTCSHDPRLSSPIAVLFALQLSLLYANVSPDDILLRDELDQLAAAHPNFSVWYTGALSALLVSCCKSAAPAHLLGGGSYVLAVLLTVACMSAGPFAPALLPASKCFHDLFIQSLPVPLMAVDIADGGWTFSIGFTTSLHLSDVLYFLFHLKLVQWTMLTRAGPFPPASSTKT